jgi:subtilisin family serine protease
LILCLVAHAQSNGGVSDRVGKTYRNVLERAENGIAQDVIVVFDYTNIRRIVASADPPHSFADSQLSIAQSFRARRREVFDSMPGSAIEELESHEHLPTSLARIHDAEGLRALLESPHVIGVNENRRVRPMLAESLPLIEQPQVAVRGSIGSGSTVAVIDTGIDYTRSAFGSCSAPGVPATCRVIVSQSFVANDNQLDPDGHGTNVGAIVAGVAPGAKLISLRVFAAGGGGASDADIQRALNWVIANKSTYNIVSVNMSLGGGREYAPVTNSGDTYVALFAQVRAAGILPIVSAGNDAYKDSIQRIAAAAGAVSVGAVYDSSVGPASWRVGCSDQITATDLVTCFSNSASFLTVLAPGAYASAAGISMAGTSQASPHVAGAVAVLRSAFPGDSLDAVINRLKIGVPVTDPRNDVTTPRLNMKLAMSTTQSCTWVVSPLRTDVGYTGGSFNVSVTGASGCTWSAQSAAANAEWIVVTSGATGTSTGTVSVSVGPNRYAASRIGTVTVAGQALEIAQEGSSANSSDVLANGNFELGQTNWTESSPRGYNIIAGSTSADGLPWDISGNKTQLAWFCGYNTCSERIYQELNIPTDAQSATLRFRYWTQTAETTADSAYDSLQIVVESPPNGTSYALTPLSNLSRSATWQYSPQYDLSRFRGQRIRVALVGTTDGSLATSFYVDDISLMVQGAAADTLAPSVPAQLRAIPTADSAISLTWSASSDNIAVTAYRIFRDGMQIATVGNVVSFRDSGLRVGVAYVYAVSACDLAGNCSSQSANVSALTVSTIRPATDNPVEYLSGAAGGDYHEGQLVGICRQYWCSKVLGVSQRGAGSDGIKHRRIVF